LEDTGGRGGHRLKPVPWTPQEGQQNYAYSAFGFTSKNLSGSNDEADTALDKLGVAFEIPDTP